MCCINKLALYNFKTFQRYPCHNMETVVILDRCNLFYCLSHVKYTLCWYSLVQLQMWHWLFVIGVDYFSSSNVLSLSLNLPPPPIHPHTHTHTSQRHSWRRTEFSTCCQFTFCSHYFAHKVMTSPPQRVCRSKWSIGYMMEMLQLFGQISFHISEKVDEDALHRQTNRLW